MEKKNEGLSLAEKTALKIAVMGIALLFDELHSGFGEIARAIRKKGELLPIYDNDTGYDVEYVLSKINELESVFNEQCNSEKFKTEKDVLEYLKNIVRSPGSTFTSYEENIKGVLDDSDNEELERPYEWYVYYASTIF